MMKIPQITVKLMKGKCMMLEQDKEENIQIKDLKTGRNEGLNRAREKKRTMNKCNRCGDTEHFGTECPRILEYAICTRCRQRGHEWNKCPTYPMEKKVRI